VSPLKHSRNVRYSIIVPVEHAIKRFRRGNTDRLRHRPRQWLRPPAIRDSTTAGSIIHTLIHHHRRKDDPTEPDSTAKVRVAPARYVTVKGAAAATGLSEASVRKRIERGIWLDGKHWRKAPDQRIYVDLRAIEVWIESGS
jgi:hypothetical protein